MTINLLAFGIFAYFLGLFFSGLFSLLEGHWKKSVQLFVISNLIGFITGVLFLLNFPSRQLILTNLDWFFLFSPSLDLLSAIFFVLISGVSALVGIYSFRYLEIYKETYNPRITQFLTVLFVFGMQGVLFANNTFSFLFLWEVMSIASFFLVFADRKEQSLKAAFLYFVMTHLGASAILAGFLILGNGSLLFDLSDISTASQGLSFGLKILAFFLFFFGFGSKAGLVPFHIWLPEAHPAAPSNVSALMSGLMLKVAVYGFIRVAFSFTDLPEWVGLTVISFGLLSAFSGALRAVIERDIKKVFAYSSIENMGIIFSMLGTALYISVQSDQLGILAISNIIFAFAILHIASHSFFKTGLFLSSGVIMSRFHSKSLEKMGGLAKIMPVFSFAFLLVILGSLPLPPFGTFYGEWGFIQNIISLMSDLVLKTDVLAVLILIVSILGLVSGLAFFAMTTVFGLSMLGLRRCKELDYEDEGRV
ncbi:MAG: hypothetical protein HGA61_03820, partial [Candidatus Moranbacteria bacterium]|nr:hypothetical protein [Candidatus Moranbacteria bacterium]